jgi:tRNA(fMet)-specific endonuclease VapC
MAYLLDTSAAIPLRDKSSAYLDRLSGLGSDLSISIITQIELINGIYRDAHLSQARRLHAEILFDSLNIIAFDDGCAKVYNQIIAHTGYSRRKTLDHMIAATALQHGLTLVTLNSDDFKDIPDLKLIIW